MFQWHKAFSEDRKSAELIPPPGYPVSASNEVNMNTILVLTEETPTRNSPGHHCKRRSLHGSPREVENSHRSQTKRHRQKMDVSP